MRHQRRAPHPPVALAISALLALKKLQKFLAYLIAGHFFGAVTCHVCSVPLPGTSAPVLQDTIPRLSQTPQTPATKPEWHRLQPVLLNRLMSRLPQDPYGLIPAHVIDIGAKQSHSRGLP